jgi:hypothetical protein
MYKNKSAEEGDKATNIQMAFTSLLWPAYVGWLCWDKLMHKDCHHHHSDSCMMDDEEGIPCCECLPHEPADACDCSCHVDPEAELEG